MEQNVAILGDLDITSTRHQPRKIRAQLGMLIENHSHFYEQLSSPVVSKYKTGMVVFYSYIQ